MKEDEYEYLSADEVAYELNPKNPLAMRLKAGKEFFIRLNHFAKDDRNFLIESTLSGKSLLNVIAAEMPNRCVATSLAIFLPLY